MTLHTMARDLSRLISGRVADSHDNDYRNAILVDNGRVAHEPSLVVVPVSESDVSQTVKYCAKHNIRLTTKCGGHSASGYCLNTDGIVLDLRHLNQMSLDRSTGLLKLGMGARWHEVYDYMEASQTGLIPIGGGCPSVGVAGFLLGGGYSFVSRSYGLGVDHLKSLRLVLADGSIVNVDENSTGLERDLFWACRGAGGGNFGIAVEGELQTKRPNADTMLMGQLLFPFFRIEEILDFYNAWVLTLPDEMAVYGYLGNQPDARRSGQPILGIRFTPVFNGSFADGMQLLQPLMGLGPIAASFNRMTIAEFEELIGGGTSIKGRSAYVRSAILPPRGLTSEVARTCQYYMSRCPSPDSFIVWTHAGGAIGKDKPGATSFAHRDGLFVPEVKAIWESAKPQDARRNIEWAYDFFEELSKGAQGAYLNYIDPLLTDWTSKYYRDQYPPLVEVKNKCDPGGFFDFQQGIGSTFAPSGSKPLDLSPLNVT